MFNSINNNKQKNVIDILWCCGMLNILTALNLYQYIKPVEENVFHILWKNRKHYMM